MTADSISPVVLCGGSGTRLWPLSRAAFPKQFVPLLGEKSLLEMTLERLSAFGSVLCVGSEDHRFLIGEAGGAAKAGLRILLEPEGKNTAAAVALAALASAADDLLLICPADHFIPDTAAFVAMAEAAAPLARDGRIVTFGVPPTAPQTAYGYIQKGKSLGEAAYAVARFVEKPNAGMAATYLAEGGYFWNAGIFLARASVLLDGLAQHAPDILDVCRRAMADPAPDGIFLRPDAAIFEKCRSDSLDYALMERADNVALVPFRGPWSDVGSWSAVADLAADDGRGNRLGGVTANAYCIDSTNTFIHAGSRTVVALGTKDLLIVDTPDALLVTDRAHAESVKQAVGQLQNLKVVQVVSHRKVARPWGWYDSVDTGARFQVKRISVRPGATLSLQMHHHRAEHWIVVKGTARVTRGDEQFLLTENQSTYIPLGVVHRLENPGAIDLELIEVQSGTYLGEDDIVRFEDVYGRVPGLAKPPA